MYKVIEYFKDLHDSRYAYNVGDIFPRDGVTVTDARLEELAGSNNKRGCPLIALVEEVPKKPVRRKKAAIVEPTEE